MSGRLYFLEVFFTKRPPPASTQGRDTNVHFVTLSNLSIISAYLQNLWSGMLLFYQWIYHLYLPVSFYLTFSRPPLTLGSHLILYSTSSKYSFVSTWCEHASTSWVTKDLPFTELSLDKTVFSTGSSHYELKRLISFLLIYNLQLQSFLSLHIFSPILNEATKCLKRSFRLWILI